MKECVEIQRHTHKRGQRVCVAGGRRRDWKSGMKEEKIDNVQSE
jgi:hypothetical protein